MPGHHLPAERDGCYYQRVDDCCWLCLLRMLRHGVRAALPV